MSTPATNISLLDVVEAIEGPVRLNQCIEEGPSCERKAWCPAHQVWAEAQAAVTNVLGGASMASLAARAKTARYQLHERNVWIAGVPKKVKAKQGQAN